MAESDSILVGFSFRLSSSNVCYPLAEKPDHERVLALDVEGFNGEKLRDPVRHDLFAGRRLEAAQKFGAHETGCREISLFC